jgi:hypothetical protein
MDATGRPLLDWAFGADTGDGKIYRFPEEEAVQGTTRKPTVGDGAFLSQCREKRWAAIVKQFRLNCWTATVAKAVKVLVQRIKRRIL